jgi:hypothetical protein
MAMIAMTTRSSIRVKPRERMIRSCGLPVRNGSLKADRAPFLQPIALHLDLRRHIESLRPSSLTGFFYEGIAQYHNIFGSAGTP